VRPSSMVLLGPLFLDALSRARRREQLAALATLAATITAWAIPMMLASGGVATYFGALFSLWQRVPAQTSIFNSSPATSLARALTVLLILGLCFGTALIAPFHARRIGAPMDRAKLVFTGFWTLPALCFFTFIFLKFVNSGYLLLLVPPGCLWLGAWAWRRYEVIPWPRGWKLAAAGLLMAVNVLIFLDSPFYCSYRSMRQFERELASIEQALPAAGSPADTLIVGFDAHFLGYRHAGYYLPGYLTVQYPAVELPQGRRIFSMQGGDTTLLPALPRGGYTRFVLFPLPGDEADYQQYLDTVLKKLPRQDLTTLHAGGHAFVTGPIRDLGALFP
jgi:hypothetical protein